MKRLTAVSLILLALALIFSCSTEPEDITERADLEITTSEVKTRTILPVTPDITSYTVTLTGPETHTQTFSTSDPIQFSGILVGEYTIKVEGKTEDGTIVAEGSESVTVNASGSNSAEIYLSYLTSGTGTMVIDISWEERTTGSGPFDEALEQKKLSFQAMNNETGEAYGPKLEVGEDDFAAKKFKYVATELDPSDGTPIYFDIYTEVAGEPQVIARTFYTVVQIIPNLTSMPDSNETNNFKITDESIIQYIKNVRKSSVKAIINEEHPASAIDIEWEYPKLSNGNFNATLKVSLYKEGDDSRIAENDFEYNNETDRTGTWTIGGGVNDIELSPNDSYYVTFQNTSETGYSQVLTALTGIKTKVTVTGIEITSKVEEYYTMGDILKVDATITPEDATDKDYTIAVTNSEGVTIDQEAKTVTFNSSGDYTITVTPTDISASVSDTVSDTANTYVKLSTPENFSASLTEKGISISWTAVSSADGYVIEKAVPDVGNSQIEANDGNTTSDGDTITYVDAEVYAGKTHTYTIKAIRNDNEKYNSLPSSETSVSVKSTDIEIINPPDITTQELPEIDFGNQYLVEGASSDEEHYSISISLNAAIEGATNYQWLLNGVSIANSTTFSSAVQNVTITADTEGLDLSRLYESANTLELIVTVDGTPYSTSGTFYVVSTDLTNIKITNPSDSNQVTLGTPLQLGVNFTPSVEDSENAPRLIWTVASGGEGVVDLSGKGLVTAIDDGEVTIRATAIATGKYDEITLKTYIPAEYIEIQNTTGRDFMFMRKNGVTVESGFDSVSLSAVAKRNDGKTISEEARTITWSIPEGTSNLTLSSASGETITASSVDSTSGGDIVITASTVDGIQKTETVHVHDMDVYLENVKVTGGDGSTPRSASGYQPYNMELRFSCSHTSTPSGFSVDWYFGDDPNDNSRTSLNISDENNFTAYINRYLSMAEPYVTADLKYENKTACKTKFIARY